MHNASVNNGIAIHSRATSIGSLIGEYHAPNILRRKTRDFARGSPSPTLLPN